MRLITGGAWQGKTAFARTLETERDPETRKEGEADQVPPEEWKHLDLLCHVHRWVRRAVQEGDTKTGSLMSGQIAGMIRDIPTCQEIIDRLVTETDKLMKGTGIYE